MQGRADPAPSVQTGCRLVDGHAVGTHGRVGDLFTSSAVPASKHPPRGGADDGALDLLGPQRSTIQRHAERHTRGARRTSPPAHPSASRGSVRPHERSTNDASGVTLLAPALQLARPTLRPRSVGLDPSLAEE